MVKTDISWLYLREHAMQVRGAPGGRGAFFPFALHRTFWEVMSEDQLKLLRNAVVWAMAEESSPLQVEGRGLLNVTGWRQPGSITVHMVNLTNPVAMTGLYRGFCPVAAQRVRVRVPEKVRGKAGASWLRVGQWPEGQSREVLWK